MIPQIAWFAIGLILLLIIAQVDEYIGGWLLIITVMGLIWNAYKRDYLK